MARASPALLYLLLTGNLQFLDMTPSEVYSPNFTINLLQKSRKGNFIKYFLMSTTLRYSKTPLI